jgi:hypothetical protein
MPELCRFRGISIVMYRNEEGHYVAHFHARYAGVRASIGLDGTLIAGELPTTQLRLVQMWAAQHQEELAANWQRARNRETLHKIDPLA